MPITAMSTNDISPAFTPPRVHRGTLGELAVTEAKTSNYVKHLAHRHDAARSFMGNKFNEWASQLPKGAGTSIELLTRFFDTDSSTRSTSTQAAVPHPSARPVSILAQSELSAAGPAPGKRTDMSLPELPRLGAGSPLQITDLLLALSSKNASIAQSLPALLCSLTCFIKDTEERLEESQRPGVHTMAKQLGLCLGHLEQAQARSVLTKLEGELGSSAHSVIQFAGHRVRCERKSATPALVRLSQCEYLLKGLMQGLRNHLHDVGARTNLQTPVVKDFNELSPLERTAYSEALSV